VHISYGHERNFHMLYQAVAIPHYAPIANIIQLATHHRVGEDYDEQKLRPGDICCCGACVDVYSGDSVK
jgi:hypothetical protein